MHYPRKCFSAVFGTVWLPNASNRLSETGESLIRNLGAIAAAVFLSIGQSESAIKTWDAGGGDQLWSTANNWNTDGVPASGDTIVFGSSFATGTAIQLNGNRTINDLSITSATNFSLNGNILTLASGDLARTATSGTTTINSALVLGNSATWSVSGGLLQITGGISGSSRDITISGSGAVTISGIIATGSGKINATGTGLLTLTGANTYTDTTKIFAGSVINIQNSNALGTTGGITDIDNGGALQLQGNISVGAENLTLFGSGISNTGGLRNISGNNSWAGKITLDNATATHRINSDSGTLTIDGSITESGKADNKDLTFGGLGNITVNGAITASTGDMILTKDGTGTLVLNGVNTFRGSVTITDGILSVATIGNGGVSGNLGRASNIASNLVFNGGTLRYTGATASTDRNFTINTGKTAIIDVSTNNLTFTGGSAASSGGLTKTGAGTLTLNAPNLHTGLTTITGGALAYGASNVLSTGGVTVNGSSSVLAIGANSDSVGTVTLSNGGSITGSSGILTSTSAFAMESGSVSAILGGTSIPLNKTTSGTVTLSGVNTYTGVTTLTDGVLSVATIGNGGVSGNLGAATNAATNLVFNGGTLRYTGATASTNRNFTINSAKTAVFDVTANNLTFSGVSTTTTGGLSKTGAGTLTLTGANLHTGNTTVRAGTLALSGAGNLASTNIIVGDAGSSGAALDATTKTGGLVIGSGKTVSGIGTINATTTIQGTISPGNSGAGILSNVGNIDLQGGSTAEFQLNGSAAGTQYDQLKITGSATLNGVLSISMGYTPAINTLFFVVVNDGTDAITGRFSNALVNGSVYTLGGQHFKVSYFGNFEAGIPSFTGGNDFVLMAVPEPSVALSLLGAAGLMLRRRRAIASQGALPPR